ncbi:hypothetical protein MPTK1_Vg00985 [Marchantia polymorpha subsp. ruderalis]|uniref:F-box domain-containing protein n=1 Tax=Marchantia polymorpha TaxID=3197 RepID=A0A2R6VX15_MARPO|nr:hypothetical protein MARPO_YA0023 [Marchantia polymorpha]BBN20628.1 hypothetical protein Mp_Vg00985 [Marchantia polymorpha subsp. ruderalis]BBN20629.1 hypothetical protein Mp_Vg00985 [Marchantia polymorpha subsp. ruderalis]BBN20630.1 hypothetical protein Mp_Vg00990 [Marchantia polymorpha subsp. ruderalis]|eukprot:PTQ26143.1 hypothetical protein MARPO_YA0023 [Marchantia polymorpha]
MVLRRNTVACKQKTKQKVTVTMDGNLWRTFPEELMDRVLACLPLVSLFRARGVCKKWNAIIHSRIFLEVCAEVSFRETYFLLLPSLGEEILCASFNSSSNRWHQMPSLAFLPPHVKHLDGGAGGLLLFSVGSHIHYLTLYVCNPMTRQWKRLPSSMHKRTPILRHMVVDRQMRGYKIVLAGNIDFSTPGSERNYCTSTEVYDSTSDMWLKTSPLPLNVDLNWSSAYSDGLLYCVANEVGSSKLGITAYDVLQGVWCDRFYGFPDGISLAQVVESRGNIFAVAEEYKSEILKSIHVLKFNLRTGLWTEVSRLPRSLLRDFKSLCEEESFNSVVQVERIFLTSFRGNRVLVFDISSRSWSWLTPCEHFRGKDHRAVGFTFEPCLHISP